MIIAIAIIAGGVMIVAGVALGSTHGTAALARRAGMTQMRNGTYVKFIGGYSARLVREAGQNHLSYDMRPLLTSLVSCTPASFTSDRREVTGMPDLDRAACFHGHEEVICAFLGPRADDIIRLFSEHNGSIENGIVKLPLGARSSYAELEAKLGFLAVLGASVRSDSVPPGQRLRRVVANQEAPVRARVIALEKLVRFYAGVESETALRIATQSFEPELMQKAALLTDDAERMAALAKDESFAAPLRLELLAGFERVRGVIQLVSLLRELVPSPDEDVSVFAIKRLGASGDFASAPRMMGLLPSTSRPRRRALLTALATLADETLERPTCDLLPQLDPAEVALAATVLGKIGSVAAIPVLRAAHERLGLFSGAEKRRIEVAIAQIQSRAQGAEAGQLSVSAEASGAVSLPK